MKECFSSDRVPQPVGPYSQAVKAGNFLFLSGQIPIDPDSNKIVCGDITDQTKCVLNNIKGLLEENNLSLEAVIKATIYVRNMEQFVQVNEVYGSYFTSNYPARVTVEVSRLPKDVDIEIDAIALL
ncbi:MAG: RidA family protein [Candidatus Ancaeobacter aquaticus]|nr:RidA family protein [Candidatus Ancaeobacter aquaticus]